MATADQYAEWIVTNEAKKGTKDFNDVVAAYKVAKDEEVAATSVEAIPTGVAGVTEEKFSEAEKLPETTFSEDVIGTGEAALTLATGVTGGTAGFVGGAVKGLAEQLLSGEFGTQQAADLVEQSALEGAKALTFEPRTRAGQEITRDVGKALQVVPPVIPLVGEASMLARGTAPVIAKSISTAGEAVEGAFKYQSPTKQRIGRLIAEGTGDLETAKFKPKAEAPGAPKKPDKPNKLQKFLDIGGPKVSKDKIAIEAIKQGFDEGVIAAVKGASRDDKKIMFKMANIMEIGKKNARFAMINRPSDVVGDSLMKRIKIVRKANSTAGKQLDGVANSLRGKQVDFDAPVNKFVNDLEGMGIAVSDDLKLSFAGSDIEGATGPISVISRVFDRMKGTKPPDAYDLHRMKRFIDEQVTYGKNAEGLAGKAEEYEVS